MSLASGSWSSAKLGTCVPEYQRKIPGPLLYLKGWFDAMAGQDDPVIIPTKQ
jgi:hypothetical protein